MSVRASWHELTQAQCRAVLENVQDALFVTDSAGTVIYMNRAASRLYGFEEREGREIESIDLQDYAARTFQVTTLEGVPIADDDQPLMRALRGEAYKDVELLVRRLGDDDTRVYVFSGDRVAGNPPLGVLTVRDETDRWRAERRYRVAFEADPAPSVIARLSDARILQANEGMAELTGMTTDDLTDRSLGDLKPLRQSHHLEHANARLREGRRMHKVRTILVTAERNEVQVVLSARAIEIEGQACGIFTFIDISELESARREHQEAQNVLNATLSQHADEKAVMESLAITDPLTGIPNRRGLNGKLLEEFSRARRYGTPFSISLLDLDHFKAVNDRFGHESGDAALRAIADLLKDECRDPDVAGRWGGEEFMMILPESGHTEAIDVADRVRERVEAESFAEVGDLTVSIGVASFRYGDTAETLFRRADRALYAAKKRGRNRVEAAPIAPADD